MYKLLNDTKGQYIALITLAGLFIFTGMVLLFTDLIEQSMTVETDTYDIIDEENRRVTDTLIKSGFPTEWNTTNVERIGFLTQERYNQSKFQKAKTIYDNNVTRFKNVIGATQGIHITVKEEGMITGTIGEDPSNSAIITSTTRSLFY